MEKKLEGIWIAPSVSEIASNSGSGSREMLLCSSHSNQWQLSAFHELGTV